MPASRTILRIGGRGLAVLAAGALGAAALGAAAVVPWPAHRVEPLAESIQPAESRQLRVCPGSALELADDAESVSLLGQASIATVAQPEDVAVEEVPLTPVDAEAPDAGGGPIAIATAPGAVDAGMLAGGQSQRVDAETVAGFAAAACTEPVAEAWFAAGSTEVGRTTLLLLANPGEVTASVDVRVSTETGAVEAPAGLGLLVEPGTQRVVSIAGLAPGAASPVVHVTSSGAIAASLEQTSIDGLAPSGLDLVGATAAPATSQVIPGVVVPQAGGLAVEEDHADGDAHPIVRLLAPGAEAVDVTVSVLPESGAEGAVFDATLQPGQVSDVPLGELAAGSYTVRVEGDGPVVAGARATTAVAGEPAPADLAWFSAALPLLEETLVSVPAGPAAKLHLANPGGADIEVRLAGTPNASFLVVPAGGSVSVAVDAEERLLLSGAAGAHAAVTFAGARQLAGFAVQPPGPLEAPIVVAPR